MYTVDGILRTAGVTFEAAKFGAQLTAGNQLIGTYADLLRFRGADNAYRGWEVHHIFEALDIDRLGLSAFSPDYEQQICVLLPAAAHHRVNSVLRRANPTLLTATSSELEPAYREAYQLVGNYCGSSESAISEELLSIFKAVLKNLTDSAATALDEQLVKARNELQRLERLIALEKGLHAQLAQGSSPSVLQAAAFVASMMSPLTAAAALVNPANRPVIGAAVNTLNPKNRPELSIWAKAEANVSVARQALGRRDLAGAATATAIGHGHFMNADAQFQAWRDGIPLAGRRLQLAIGAAAVAAAIVAIGVYAVEATAAAGATGAVAAGSTSTGVRVATEVQRGVRVIVTASSLAEEQAGEAILTEEVPKLFMRR